jgi:hypothetical protein
MVYSFEQRPYGPDSTSQEVQAIQDCIQLSEPGIVSWRELPIQSLFHLDLFEKRLKELTRDLDSFDLLVDLVQAAPPPPEIRARLQHLFKAQEKIRRIAVFTGKNFMLNVAAKFVLGGSVGLRNFSVHKSREQALEELRHGRKQ